MKLRDVLPKDFEWCGACGTGTRPLADFEAEQLITRAFEMMTEDGRGLDILNDLQWILEIHGRAAGIVGPCMCGRFPRPVYEDAPERGFHLEAIQNEHPAFNIQGVGV